MARLAGGFADWSARDLLTSLSVRIVAVTLIWAAVALPAVAITLNALYRDRIQSEFDVRLDQLTTLLIASATLRPNAPPQSPGDFGEVLFSLPIANGWYWQIEPATQSAARTTGQAADTSWPLTSASLLGATLDIKAPRRSNTAADRVVQSSWDQSTSAQSSADQPPTDLIRSATTPDGPAPQNAAPDGPSTTGPSTPDRDGAPGGSAQSVAGNAADTRLQVFNADLPDGQRLRVAQLVVTLPDGPESAAAYRFTVTGNRDEVDRTVAGFADKLTQSLFVLALALLILPLALVYFGLRPLKRIQSGLTKIRRGDWDRLEVNLPVEVRPLQVELNGLLDANTAIVERARTHVGNLAHALKTPVSVMLTAAEQADPRLADRVLEQTAIMRDQVDHHLNRARTAARVKVLGVETPVGPVVDGLVRTLGKLFPAIDVNAIDVDRGLMFLGERQDLEEVLGNLLENACKWARGQVLASVQLLQEPIGERGGTGLAAKMVVLVEDDGPGLTPEQARAALKRGQRLDETTPGTGLGLAIVADTVALYGGDLELSRSALGGLRARLVLPARSPSSVRRSA